MLTDPVLRSQVDALWDKLWSGGLSNPLDAIEQLSFLIFLKRLDEREQDAERAARLRGKKFHPIFPDANLRWAYWTQLPADKALRHVKEKVLSLDDKRQKVPENDIPDLLECWKKRKDVKFQQKRAQRLADLEKQIAPQKTDRLKHHATLHRLKLEEVIAADGNADKARVAREQAEAELAELQSKIAPLQQEINQLGREFWVSKHQVKANNYDLSASRYRQVEQDETFYEKPDLTLERLGELERESSNVVRQLLNHLAAYGGLGEAGPGL
jgi:hypothetical protein